MEKLTLKPLSNEIIINNGATEGAVDLFCYKPDDTVSRNLGALYVVGHRNDETSNMGYMVSLIAALARREYYGQPGTPPREAFTRTLRKANEVVEEFFRSSDIKLSVGIIAVAGGQIMVSKLDKFKILLAREEQVIDVLGNVALFTKEYSERQRFSSVVHGSIQVGDRILAFVPTRGVTAREKSLKNLFLTLDQTEFAHRLEELGQQHATFATAMLHIDITQTSEPALMPSPQPPELTQPVEVVAAPAPTPSLAWAPRQQSAPIPDTHEYDAPDTEVPHIISSEFSLGTRRTSLARLWERLRFIRLDQRGKAIMLAVTVTLITGSVLFAKSIFIASPAEQKEQQALMEIENSLEKAHTQSTEGNTIEARSTLTRALAALEALASHTSTARDMSASILESLDTVDHAQLAEPKLIASPAPNADAISLAVWASSSQSVRVGGVDAQGTLWVAQINGESLSGRVSLGMETADLLIGWDASVLALNLSTRTITRILGGHPRAYVIPIAEKILDAAEFSGSLYVLTETTILKISDLDTEKPVTKRWLQTDDQLAPGAQRLWVDGSVYALSGDGSLATYYKGKRAATVQIPISPSGTWRLLPGSDGLLAIAVGDARRIYLIDPTTGDLIRTLKVDSQIPFTHVAPGSDGSVLLLTSEGKLWQVSGGA